MQAVQAGTKSEEINEVRSLAATPAVAPTLEDMAADLAQRSSDAIASTAPAQVCLYQLFILHTMLYCALLRFELLF